jgi:DNA-binding transcriptional MerR regulator
MAQLENKGLPNKRYFRIGEVCSLTGLKPHVLRYWETEFKQVKPNKTKSNQRLYRKQDVETIIQIKHLLYERKFTIAGAKTKLEEKRKKSKIDNGPKQIKMEFSPTDHDELIKYLTSEIKVIHSMLDKNTKPE